MQKIAHIENNMNNLFGIPRQSMLSPTVSRIVFEKEFADKSAIRGIEGYSHLWLIWQFDKNKNTDFSPTVRPPRLGGNTRVGVFATRSPYRPNALGLSSVRLLSVGDVGGVPFLTVEGADIAHGTPIFDIKPYIAYTDSHPDAVSGFADEVKEYALSVGIPPECAAKLSQKQLTLLQSILSQDPRPSYQDDESRIYGFDFEGREVRFSVSGKHLKVISIE